MESKLGKLFEEAGVEPEKLVNIVQLLQTDVMSAMAAVGELNLSPEVLSQVMGVAMADPAAIDDLAKELGIGEDELKAVRDQIQGPPT